MTAAALPGTIRTWASAKVAVALAWSTVVATMLIVARGGMASSIEAQLPVGFVTSELAASALLAASAWAVYPQHPAVSTGLAVTTVGLLLPVWAGWASLPDQVRAGLLALGPPAIAGTAQVGLRWSTDTPASRPLQAVYWVTIVGSLVHFFTLNPSTEPGCIRLCIDATPLANGVLHPRLALAVTGTLVVASALVAAVAVLRTHRPRAPRLITGGVLTALALLAAPHVVRWTRWSDRGTSGIILLLPFAAGAIVGVAVLIAVIRTWRTRVWVERLVARLADTEAALSDPGGATRGIQFAVPGEGRWVDWQGRPAREEQITSSGVVVSDRSGPVARLLVADSEETGEMLGKLAPATRLALKNAQLAAVTRARVAEVAASRRRVVAASDAERRRIERDLHDGAQQRLVSAAFYLNLARPGLPEHFGPRAEMLVGDALRHLRQLAHGMFPSILTNEGLWAALDELARASAVPVDITLSGDDKVGVEAAMAAYATVAAVLGHAGQESTRLTRVSARRDGHTLEVVVEIDHGGNSLANSDLTDITDRVGALGGNLTVSSTRAGTFIEAAIPCAS